MNGTEDYPPTLREQASALRSGRLSPVELTRLALERASILQPQLNAFITLCADKALESARQAEAEIRSDGYRSPLHGLPICYKDLLDTAGIRTTAGSRILADRIPGKDAKIVGQLKEAGVVCIGKTNLHEFAFGITSNNPHFGAVHNPWNLRLIPGGSSGGSAAALAAGICAASIGTDTGGSIRIPASACGCVGLKPTYDLLSRHGVLPLSWSLDHVGPMGRTVADTALLLAQVAEARLPFSAAVDPECHWLEEVPPAVRLGICPDPFFAALHPEVAAAVRTAITILETHFGTCREVRWPSLKHADLVGTVIAFAEAGSYHETWVRTRPGDYSPDMLDRLHMGLLFSAADYLRCRRLRRQMVEEAEAIFREIDLLIYPSLPFAGVEIGKERVFTGHEEEDIRTASIRLNRPANLVGYPAISLPCGFSVAGAPIGLQMMAGPHQEQLLLRIARFYETATPWHTRRPAHG